MLARRLAECGYHVHGVDRSAEMISIAQDKCDQDTSVVFSVGDMRELRSDAHHDLEVVLCLFDSVNYLMNERDIETVLTFVSKALRPGGVFIFDFNRPVVYAAHDGETMVRKLDSGTLQMELGYSTDDRIATTVFRFPNGDVETHLQRALELEDLAPLLEELALPITACYSDFTRRPVSAISERLICICRKESAT